MLRACPALRDAFPPWSVWDVMAVLCFTVAAIVLFSIIALGIAHVLTSRQHVPWGELATNPKVVIGSQLAAYPVVILFMIVGGAEQDTDAASGRRSGGTGRAQRPLGYFLSGDCVCRSWWNSRHAGCRFPNRCRWTSSSATSRART